MVGVGEYIDDYTFNLQEKLLELLGQISNETLEYFFVGTYGGISLLGPAKGKNMLHITDVKGVKVVQELISAAKTGGGFLLYTLPSVDIRYQPYPKLSYVEGVPDWGWYLGAGISLEEAEKALDSQRSRMLLHVIRNVSLGVGIVLSFSLVFHMFIRRTIARIRVNLNTLSNFFQKAATENIALEPEDATYREFEVILGSANRMLLFRKQIEDELMRAKNSAEMANHAKSEFLADGGRGYRAKAGPGSWSHPVAALWSQSVAGLMEPPW